MKTFTILIDSREKKPLLFPEFLPGHSETYRIVTRSSELRTGDYLLAEHPSSAIVERKGALRELAQNLDRDDFSRFRAAFGRLQTAARYPVLLIEGDIQHLDAPVQFRGRMVPYGAVLDALLAFLAPHPCRLLVLPCTTLKQRRSVGEWVARILIAGATECRTVHPSMPPAEMAASVTQCATSLPLPT